MGIKKLDWYIIKKFLGSFIVALGLLTVIVIIFDVSEKIDDFVQKEAPLKAIVVDYRPLSLWPSWFTQVPGVPSAAYVLSPATLIR